MVRDHALYMIITSKLPVGLIKILKYSKQKNISHPYIYTVLGIVVILFNKIKYNLKPTKQHEHIMKKGHLVQ